MMAACKCLADHWREYEANVGNRYDAWTREGFLEHCWGEHIHLGYCRITCSRLGVLTALLDL